MSLLLLISGTAGVAVTPLAVDEEIFIILPDEVPAGTPTRVWAELSDSVGANAPTSDMQIRIFRLDDTGTRQNEVNTRWMTSLGEAWYYDWTPSQVGTFSVTAACHDGGKHLFKHAAVSVRSKFDPIALALDGILVSRM